jgi:hypothetical protein
MITISINVTRIDKTALFEGKTGKFLNLALRENKDGPDQYGNTGFVAQDLGKERREAGERGPIIGNWKVVGGNKPTPKPQATQPEENNRPDIPF